MTASTAYLAISIAVLAVAVVLVFLMRGKRAENRLTPLAGLAFAFILAGIFFGEERLLGYGLMGVGVILAATDVVNRSRGK